MQNVNFCIPYKYKLTQTLLCFIAHLSYWTFCQFYDAVSSALRIHHRIGKTSGVINTQNKTWLLPEKSVLISNPKHRQEGHIFQTGLILSSTFKSLLQ